MALFMCYHRLPAKRVLRREDRTDVLPTDPLEERVDQIMDQIAQLSLLGMKKQSSTMKSDQDKVCFYCQCPGHYAIQFNLTPHKGTRCARCGKLRHSIATCLKKPYQEERLKDAHVESDFKFCLRTGSRPPLRPDQEPDIRQKQVGSPLITGGMYKMLSLPRSAPPMVPW